MRLTGCVFLYENVGHGRGSPIKVGPISRDPKTDFNALQGARTVLAAGDYDGDGRRDPIVGDTFGNVRYFRQLDESSRLTHETPIFAEAIEIGDPGIRWNVCATDFKKGISSRRRRATNRPALAEKSRFVR